MIAPEPQDEKNFKNVESGLINILIQWLNLGHIDANYEENHRFLGEFPYFLVNRYPNFEFPVPTQALIYQPIIQ